MSSRRLFAVILLGSMTVSLAAAEEEKRPARVAPGQVLLTLPSDNEAVEFCTALGEVKAKSGMGYGAGEESVRSTIRQRAAAMGANVVQMRPPALSGLMIMSGNGTAYRCSEEALAKQRAKAAEIARQAEELERRAASPIVCEAGADCELKWSRVIPWLQEHSTWKFRNVTDTLITTEGPMETPDPASTTPISWSPTSPKSTPDLTHAGSTSGVKSPGECFFLRCFNPRPARCRALAFRRPRNVANPRSSILRNPSI